jgi:hypothetical protein
MLSNDLLPFPIPFLHWDFVLLTDLLGTGQSEVPQKAFNHLLEDTPGRTDWLTYWILLLSLS